jgi:hypothetical protein
MPVFDTRPGAIIKGEQVLIANEDGVNDVYWISRSAALQLRARGPGPEGLRAFISKHAIPTSDEAKPVEGGAYVRQDSAAAEGKSRIRPIDRWDCGNGHLPHHVALTIIKSAGITQVDAMQWLYDAAYSAGPDFCETLLQPEVPF